MAQDSYSDVFKFSNCGDTNSYHRSLPDVSNSNFTECNEMTSVQSCPNFLLFPEFYDTSIESSLLDASKNTIELEWSSLFSTPKIPDSEGSKESHCTSYELPTNSLLLVEDEILDIDSEDLINKTLERARVYKQQAKKHKDLNKIYGYAKELLSISIPIAVDNRTTKWADLKFVLFKEVITYLKYLLLKKFWDGGYLLADCYSTGIFGSVDHRKAFTLFRYAAKNGHVECAYRTAYCYENGLGVRKSAERSLEYLGFAASKNHPASLFKLGMCYYYERMGCVTDNTTKMIGLKYIHRASELADKTLNQIPYELAKIYEVGYKDLVLPDPVYATELHMKAAALENAVSASILAQLYEFGTPWLPKNTFQAVKYYRQASEKGEPLGIYGYGSFYLTGLEPSVSLDYKKGFQLMQMAAFMNVTKAQHMLGYLYATGKGCSKNETSSTYWYHLSQKNNKSKTESELPCVYDVNSATYLRLISRNRKKMAQLFKSAWKSSRKKISSYYKGYIPSTYQFMLTTSHPASIESLKAHPSLHLDQTFKRKEPT